MDARRARAALLVLPAALAIAGCSSSGDDSGNGLPSGVPTDARGLSTFVESALADITSAHISLDIDLSAQSLTGEGDEQLDNGKLVALDLTENLPGDSGSIRVIVVNGETYAKLPASLNTTGKPYLLVTPESTNPIVKQLAASLDSALSSASLGSVSTFLGAAKSIDVKGTEKVGSVSAIHYSVKVDIAKLPDDLPGKSELEASGLGTLPIELYLDEQGRPLKVTEDFELQGQKISTRSTVTEYNAPVTIKAPPASQVAS